MPHSSGLEFSSSRRFRLEGSRVGGRGGGCRVGGEGLGGVGRGRGRWGGDKHRGGRIACREPQELKRNATLHCVCRDMLQEIK